MLTHKQSEKIKIKLIKENLKQKDLVERFNIKHKAILSMILNQKYQNLEIEQKLLKWLGEYKMAVEINGLRYYLENGNAVITRYVGTNTNVVIPSTIEVNGTTYNVTKIGEEAFSYSKITSITIPNSVTSIGRSAFEDCSSLTSIVIPNSVTTMGKYTFYGCSSLTSIVIPNSITSIGSSAFYGCSSLIIYCEASEQPSGWSNYWNYSDRPVYWGV